MYVYSILVCISVKFIMLILIYHIFSGKYSSFEYLIKCQMPPLYHTPTLYRTPTLYTLLFKYMIKCIKHGKILIICRITLDQNHPSGLRLTKPKQHVIEIIYGRGKFVGNFNMGTL
jgi:hypothetical protein